MEMIAECERAGKLFSSTSWTLVLEAGGTESSDDARRALTQLCSIYWRPVYLFLRRHGLNLHDAEDLTQSFFADLIETRFHVKADPAKGQFRSFLLAVLKNFLANRRDYDSAQKRGGKFRLVPLFEGHEQELNAAVARSYRFDAEQVYEREWAVALLRRVSGLLEMECEVAGKGELFRALRGYLGAGEEPLVPYEQLSQRLRRSTVSLRKDVSRLRERYRSLLRGEVRQTVANDDEVDAELRYLCAAMAR